MEIRVPLWLLWAFHTLTDGWTRSDIRLCLSWTFGRSFARWFKNRAVKQWTKMKKTRCLLKLKTDFLKSSHTNVFLFVIFVDCLNPYHCRLDGWFCSLSRNDRNLFLNDYTFSVFFPPPSLDQPVVYSAWFCKVYVLLAVAFCSRLASTGSPLGCKHEDKPEEVHYWHTEISK